MKRIHSLRFLSLHGTVHFRFFTRLAELLAEAGDDLKAAVSPLLPEFNSWLAEEDAVTDWVRRSEFTKKIAGAAAETKRVMVGINAIVQAGRHAGAPAVNQSADHVHNMLKNYGNVARKSYAEVAGEVAKVLEQFAGPYAADAVTLGMTAWVQQLQTALDTFDSLICERNAEQGRKPPHSAQEVRKGIEGVYHRMKTIINANAGAGTSNDFTAFIDHLNATIDHLRAEFHRVVKDLGEPGRTLIEPLAIQAFTGFPVTPLPEVYHSNADDKPAVRLFLGKDFTVTYKNNRHAGMATLIVHGKGRYKGRKRVSFYIEPPELKMESGELKMR